MPYGVMRSMSGKVAQEQVIFTARLKTWILWPIIVEETLKVSDWEMDAI